MQIITLFIFLILSSCQSKTKDLYIITETRTRYSDLYPQVHTTINKGETETVEVCFKHKHVVPSLNPFCFSVDHKKNSSINNLDEIKSEIWQYEDLEAYIGNNYNVYSEECGKLFEDYKNVYILLKKENEYQILKVLKCYTFEN